MKKESVFRSFSGTFWIANTMELFERMAWYGMFIMLANYLTGSADQGALGFSQSEKGLMMSTLAGLVYFLPILTGAFADRFGYKKVLLLSYFMMAGGYLLLSSFRDFWSIYLSFIYLAIGAAFFKPVISASIAKTTNEKNSSIGFGIFYMLVNVGAFIGPFVGAKLKIISYDYVFYFSAAAIAFNAILVSLFYHDPIKPDSSEKVRLALKKVLLNVVEAAKDWRFMIFLFIIGGFWSMYNQLFYTFPVYIEQWVDLHQFYNDLVHINPSLGEIFGNGKGKIESEMLVNADALYIVVFQILVSALVMRFKPLRAMIGGIFICAIGIGLTVSTNNPFFMLFSIFLFALGEMSSSPKITEYIGRIAPKDKVALYMGFSFFPMFIGNVIAGVLSGPVYTRISDKYFLLAEEIKSRGIETITLNDFENKNDFFEAAAKQLNMSSVELTNYLYQSANPSSIWLIFTGIGVGAAFALWLYDRFLLGKKTD
jgi:proton-dependent oligopeptide transporter, POT family